MGRKPTLSIVVTNEAIKKTVEVIRGFRKSLSDSALEISLFINRQAGLLGFSATSVCLVNEGILLSVSRNRNVLEFTILQDGQIAYEHWTQDSGYILTLSGLNLKQAIAELKKVAPHGRK